MKLLLKLNVIFSTLIAGSTAFALLPKTYHYSANTAPKPMMLVRFQQSSLRANIQLLAQNCRHPWKVIWKTPYDYHWITDSKSNPVIKGHNIKSIIGQTLIDYPLQAVFYRGNHVLVIQQRALT